MYVYEVYEYIKYIKYLMLFIYINICLMER